MLGALAESLDESFRLRHSSKRPMSDEKLTKNPHCIHQTAADQSRICHVARNALVVMCPLSVQKLFVQSETTSSLGGSAQRSSNERIIPSDVREFVSKRSWPDGDAIKDLIL
ncbi:MAG: hypothetical protein RJA34_557 [Pseudomonadota bacterium]